MPPIGDSQLGDLLRSGVKVSNAKIWTCSADRSTAGMWGCNRRGSDLSDAILDEADLSCTTLSRAKLIGTSVQGTNFSQAWVYGAAIHYGPSKADRIALKNQALDGADGL